MRVIARIVRRHPAGRLPSGLTRRRPLGAIWAKNGGALPLARFTSSTLPLAIGIIEILLGTTLLVAPPTAGGRMVLPPVPVAAVASVMVFCGVLAFIVQVYGGVLPARLRAIAGVIVGVPLLVSAHTGWRSGMSAAVVVFVTLVAVNTVFAGRRDAVAPARGPRVDSLVLAIGVIEATIGVLLAARPDLFRNPIYQYLLPLRVWVASVFLASAGALLLSIRTRRPALRTALHAAAGLPLLLLAGAVWQSSAWRLAVLFYPTLAAFLIAHPWIERAVADRRRLAAERPGSLAFQRTTEATVWAVILLLVLASTTRVAPSDRLGLSALALVTSLFTLVWFRLPPGPNPRRRTLWGVAVYTALAGLVMHFTGGVQSPFFFLLYLPVIATAWSLPPRTIRVPTVVGLVTLLAELGWQFSGGGRASDVVLTVLRAGGLLFIAAFAYFLARRAAEQRELLNREKRELEAIIASMGEGLIVLDREGRIRVCNRAAERMFGCRHGEVEGRPLLEVMTLQREDGMPFRDAENPVVLALRRGQATRQRALAAVGAADPIPVALTVTPFYEGEGRAAGVICNLQDIRGEVEMQRMREDFFYIASHEIRTPLTVIKGNVELVLDGALGTLSDPLRHVVREVHAATDRLIRLVNDFLDAARLEHGKISLQIEPGRLPELVGQVIETLAPDARRKGLSITYRLADPAAVPLVLMDGEKALQVLFNLVGNGIKFTHEGGVEIWHAVSGGMVETHVRDSGPGVPPEHRHRLFERFGQVARGLRRESGGSGLGLYISRQLAERMNGAVYLRDSTPGEGSSFVFTLPVAPPSALRPPKPPPARAAEESGGQARRRPAVSPLGGRTGTR